MLNFMEVLREWVNFITMNFATLNVSSVVIAEIGEALFLKSHYWCCEYFLIVYNFKLILRKKANALMLN